MDEEEEKIIVAEQLSASPAQVSTISTISVERNDRHDGQYDSASRHSSQEENEADESENEDEEGEDDEDEPALKYERVVGALPELLTKDTASALAICEKDNTMALGTHAGIVHVLDMSGKRIKSYKRHLASIVDIAVDEDFVATTSIDGQVVIHSLSTPESYAFDMRRPMRTVALEPNFSKRSTRAFVCGGLAGSLELREKGWLGYRETVLHIGEGPIWQVRWRDRLIAWANDLGVKIYDNVSQSRITFIDRPSGSPRADLFKCTLHWQDDSTLLIAWADYIKVARIRARPKAPSTAGALDVPPLMVEITAVFQLDCMAAGIVPHPMSSADEDDAGPSGTRALTSLLVLAYAVPDTSVLMGDEMPADRSAQARKAAERPELRIISRAGEELANDVLSISGYQTWGCNDYALVSARNPVAPPERPDERCYLVLSPQDLVIARPRDRRDHIIWLVQRARYEEALDVLEHLPEGETDLNAADIGERYIEHLITPAGGEDFPKAARLCPKVCAQDQKRWEKWIFRFAEQRHLHDIIPFIPTDAPRLDHVVYEMTLGYFLTHDKPALLRTITQWPRGIYDMSTIIEAVRAELERMSDDRSMRDAAQEPSGKTLLMECLVKLYLSNRQPGKALPYSLRLRHPNVFDLVRENNLFTDVQDQVLLLVEFDHELMQKRKELEGAMPTDSSSPGPRESEAITLLVDHTHSIPIGRVVHQLQSRPYYLFLYLHALTERDPQLVTNDADLQVKLYAEYDVTHLINFLRVSTDYNLELAYDVCAKRDLVPEMVFLLGQMGNNKKALTLIIEHLGDVHRAIEFAKDQDDDDLWEDLLKYSETRPAFIRGLLENVGVQISPIRLIRRIKNGLEIPGLKEALIKILQDFHLQISLLQGCQTILEGDTAELSYLLQKHQTAGFHLNAKVLCPICKKFLLGGPQMLILFLCRHVVHGPCVPDIDLEQLEPAPAMGASGRLGTSISGKIAFENVIRRYIGRGCPACCARAEGARN
ncbi:vacuolar protein sorting-associated protein 41 [Fistulina hepatica ATCC 64428]|uniref:Vacuolar protein sorting-associated protein 41 n=1 Tax=Fistulina hepatica ATCC 64428 TaxID=1128425 RepID=A0A0D7AFG3_9AGAR|nr:vacuolar protein sorting-associated protein 41 [Fistulina hepatica ATCC 64428]